MTAKEAAQAIDQDQRDDAERELSVEIAKELADRPAGLASAVLARVCGPSWALTFGAMCFLMGVKHERKSREVAELERMVGQ